MAVQSGDRVRLTKILPTGKGTHYHKGATGVCTIALPGNGAWPAQLTLRMSDGDDLTTNDLTAVEKM